MNLRRACFGEVAGEKLRAVLFDSRGESVWCCGVVVDRQTDSAAVDCLFRLCCTCAWKGRGRCEICLISLSAACAEGGDLPVGDALEAALDHLAPSLSSSARERF